MYRRVLSVDDAIEDDVGSVPDLMRAGATLLRNRDPSGAAQRVRRALALVPDHGEGWDLHGVIGITAGDLRGAGAAFRRAELCAPANADYPRRLAETLRRQDRVGEAERALANAVGRGALSPTLPATWGTSGSRCGDRRRRPRFTVWRWRWRPTTPAP